MTAHRNRCRAWACLGLVGLGLAASACHPYVCDETSSDGAPAWQDGSQGALASGVRHEDLEFKERGDQSFRVTVGVDGLPTLWSDEGALDGVQLTLALDLAYLGTGQVADGATEMPRVSVLVREDHHDWLASRTATFPPSTSSFETKVLPVCSKEGCCRFGAQSCSVTLSLRVGREDGAPFHPLAVGLNVSAQAHVNTCPLGSSPHLQLELEQEP